jgi:hypothetical protein
MIFVMNATILMSLTRSGNEDGAFPRVVASSSSPLLQQHNERQDSSQEDVTARATTITLVLEEILSHRGFPHGGINE